MQTSTNKLGLGTLSLSLLWLLQPMAFAQSDSELLQAVRGCQSIGGLSARLACYDDVLPPGTDTIGNVTPNIGSNVSSGRSTSISTSPREAELEATVADLEQQLEEESGGNPVATIVEVQRPTASSSRLIASDGRVFSETNRQTIVTWPATPFDVEVLRSLTGTISLAAISPDRLNNQQSRGRGRPVRVVQER